MKLWRITIHREEGVREENGGPLLECGLEKLKCSRVIFQILQLFGQWSCLWSFEL